MLGALQQPAWLPKEISSRPASCNHSVHAVSHDNLLHRALIGPSLPAAPSRALQRAGSAECLPPLQCSKCATRAGHGAGAVSALLEAIISVYSFRPTGSMRIVRDEEREGAPGGKKGPPGHTGANWIELEQKVCIRVPLP